MPPRGRHGRHRELPRGPHKRNVSIHIEHVGTDPIRSRTTSAVSKSSINGAAAESRRMESPWAIFCTRAEHATPTGEQNAARRFLAKSKPLYLVALRSSTCFARSSNACSGVLRPLRAWYIASRMAIPISSHVMRGMVRPVGITSMKTFHCGSC